MTRRIVLMFWGRRGGGVVATTLLARRLVELGFRDDLALSLSRQNEGADDLAALDLPMHCIDTFRKDPGPARILSSTFTFRRQVSAMLDRFRPEIVFLPMPFGAMASVLDILARRVPRLVYALHDAAAHPGDIGGRLIQLAQAGYMRFADSIVTHSAFVREMAARRNPALADRTVVVPLAGLYPVPAGRRRSDRPQTPLRFISQGRLVRYKGFDLLAGALSQLGEGPEWTLTIAGDGPERDAVSTLFSGDPRLSLQLGWASPRDQRGLFETHDVLVCPYTEASQSGVVCDALSAGIPTIVTPVGALPEQIGHGRAGIVVEACDASALASGMRMMASDADLRERFSAGAAAVIEDASLSVSRELARLFARGGGR